MVPMVRGSWGQITGSRKVREFYIPKSGKTQRVRENQNTRVQKLTKMQYADCVQQFKIFSAIICTYTFKLVPLPLFVACSRLCFVFM